MSSKTEVMIKMPEEINRKVVDHLSDVNITYSENSKNNLIREGVLIQNLFLM